MKRLIVSMMLLVALIGCGSKTEFKASPVYKAHITNMEVIGITSTAIQASAALDSSLTSSQTTSIQSYNSGDVAINTSGTAGGIATDIGVNVTVQNDSDVPVQFLSILFWEESGDDSLFGPTNPRQFFQSCGPIANIVQPGEIFTLHIDLWQEGQNLIGTFVVGSTDPVVNSTMLGPQKMGVWIYAATNEMISACTHNKLVTWTSGNGAGPNGENIANVIVSAYSPESYMSLHPALSSAENHFNLVSSISSTITPT